MILHHEHLWIIWNRADGGQIIYALGGTEKQVWESVLELELMGTGQTRELLEANGWRTRPARLLLL